MVAIFHSLNRQILFVGVELLEKIKDYLLLSLGSSANSLDEITSQVLSYLEQYRLLVPREDKEDMEIARIQKKILRRPCIDTLYLILTDNCNFGCSYCFFEGSYGSYGSARRERTNMTNATAILAIGKFSKFLKKAYQFSDFHPREPSVVFYGGEPLLNVDVFYRAVVEINRLKANSELPANLKININTNGSLISEQFAKFCTENSIEVDVSIDGYQSVHDACRVLQDGKTGTFYSVMEGIKTLKRFGANVCVSCTISEQNVDNLPRIFEWFLDEAGINQIGFNPLLDSGKYQVQSPDYFKKVSASLIDCFKIARQRCIYEARMMRKVKAFVQSEIYDRDCCGCGKQIVVRPDGKMGVCHAYSGTGDFFVEPDETFDPYTHPFWQEWSLRSPLNMSQCFDCEAVSFCGGGCAHNAHMRKGSIWEVDETFCVHAKESLRWLIWDLYEQTRQ